MGMNLGVEISEQNPDVVARHRKTVDNLASRQNEDKLNFSEIVKWLNAQYNWNTWDDFTKENIMRDFKILYLGNYEIVDLELIDDEDSWPIKRFNIHIEYPTEAEQVWHVLKNT